MTKNVQTATELIVGFVNTAEPDEGREDLRSPAQLATWLRDNQLADVERATAADLRRALDLREAIRDLLSTHNEVAVDEAAAAGVLDEAARRARLEARFGRDGLRLEACATGVDGALGLVVAAVAETMVDEIWCRLKACRDETCRYAYLDTTKNRSRAWCSMRSCGNRAKVRAYRRRQEGS